MLKDSHLATLTLRSILLTLLSLSLLFAGIALLFTKVPGWSLFFGLILIPTGTALTIFTLDEVARSMIVPPPFKAVKCKVCGKITYARQDEEDVICGRCREDISEKILEEKG